MRNDLEDALFQAIEYSERAMNLAGIRADAFTTNADYWELACFAIIRMDAGLKVLAEDKNWPVRGTAPFPARVVRDARRIRDKLAHTTDRIRPEIVQDFILNRYPTIQDLLFEYKGKHWTPLPG